MIAFAGRQSDQIFLALLAVGACVLSFFIGHRLFNFSGLAASFPVGGEETDIDEDVRQEFEALLHDIDDPDTNWMTRHELRKKLANFIQKEPRLLELYGSEIRSAYPFSAGKSLKRDN